MLVGFNKGSKDMDLRGWLSGMWEGFEWCLLDDEDP